VCSTAGKGIVADSHPLSLSASLPRPEVLEILNQFDVILAIGTELSDTESFEQHLTFSGKLIRIDIDAGKINDLYPATIGIVADASDAAARIASAIAGHENTIRNNQERWVKQIKLNIASALSPSEQQHQAMFTRLQSIAPADTIWSGDACQIVYSGAFMMPTQQPRQWFYPAGYCALGCALPNAIGAKLVKPNTPVVVLVGDGGVMFTVQELVTAAELELSLPIIVWDNGGYKQIQDDMDRSAIQRIGVEGMNPDFLLLAKACHCDAVLCENLDDLESAFTHALTVPRPTVIVIKEDRENQQTL